MERLLKCLGSLVLFGFTKYYTDNPPLYFVLIFDAHFPVLIFV